VRERSRIPGLGGPARGRTAALEGFARIDGRSAVEVRVAADLRKLHSGRPGRDAFLGGRSLDTRDYPVATFVSSAPVDVPPGTSQERVRGRLTLHGAAGDVVLRARLQRAARRIEVLGEVTIRPSEFGIRPPDAGIFSVPDSGAIEFHLVFAARRRWRHERHHG
jgi:polyisoprenoid-binding protein YceI